MVLVPGIDGDCCTEERQADDQLEKLDFNNPLFDFIEVLAF
ncbi:hypothetical protein DFO73_10515 [Cytobacillus oceanisediminis]|jgi:hypothetical protein|uniref:Uncharacterized protein n=1 Tax=Cytobacillus oceanisediminis TaxID=665099 RepID=A0A2V2ZWI4_9BACI|nr:hypothetical protein DFO73_10515 [Cytobacillus oceanisediminis]